LRRRNKWEKIVAASVVRNIVAGSGMSLSVIATPVVDPNAVVKVADQE
jgi:hypothetical protein